MNEALKDHARPREFANSVFHAVRTDLPSFDPTTAQVQVLAAILAIQLERHQLDAARLEVARERRADFRAFLMIEDARLDLQRKADDFYPPVTLSREEVADRADATAAAGSGMFLRVRRTDGWNSVQIEDCGEDEIREALKGQTVDDLLRWVVRLAGRR